MTASTPTIFDQQHYLELIRTRGAAIRTIAPELKKNLKLETALDVGCGVGFFSQILRECGLNVAGIDGREVNITEARQRFPQIRFSFADIEDTAVLSREPSDLVLCFGLLYHLESPLRAIRHLRALTGKVLLLESMCIPGTTDHALLRTEPEANDQSLTNLAFYSTEQCIVDMLYGVGFHAVYRLSPLPDHDDFRETTLHQRRRTVLCASLEPLQVPGLKYMARNSGHSDPWQKKTAKYGQLITRASAFASRPASEKYWAIKRRILGLQFGNSNILRLPFGGYWLVEQSALDHDLASGSFERPECLFVDRLLRPGMTVIDAGAHHGLYSLLASRKVGHSGKVLAFEPSARERVRLEHHLRVNRCRNVTVYPVALGSQPGTANLFVVDGSEDYCNSLRPPAVDAKTKQVSVEVTTLDEILAEAAIHRVDFMKVDVEGGELDVLRGAKRVLTATPRPVLLVEVYDVRTMPWGYKAAEIVRYVNSLNYRWFRLTSDGHPESISPNLDYYDMNLVAVPEEQVLEIECLRRDRNGAR